MSAPVLAPSRAHVRIVAVAAALAVGVLLAEWLRPPVSLAVAAVVAAGVATALRRRTTAVLALALAVGCLLAAVRLDAVELSWIARAARDGARLTLEGRVEGEPVVRDGAARFVLVVARAATHEGWVPARGRAQVRVRPLPPAVPRPGARARVTATLSPLRFTGMDSRAAAAARRLARAGIAARAFASPGDLVTTGRARDPLTVVAEAGRRSVRRAAARLPEAARGLLLGLTIGDTSALDPEVELDFRATGLSHVVAVSGANVAMVLGLVALALRALRAGRRVSVGIMSVVLVCFMAVTRFEPSVVRAGTMAGIGLAGLLLGARRDARVALAAAAVMMIAADPFVIHAPGFQLSMLATLGLLEIAPRLARALPRGRVAAAAAVTLGAQLAVAPLIALRFHELSLVAVAANLAVAPAVPVATVAGFAGAMAAAAWPPLGVVGLPAVPAIAWMESVARALANLPLASVSTPGGIAGASVVCALCTLAFVAGRRRAATVALALVALVPLGARAIATAPPGGLRITMLDVGQGEAIVVSAGGATMLVDGGPDARATLRLLRAHGVRRVDLLVMTHPHADHIDGLALVAARLPVGRALDPATEGDVDSYRAYVAALRARGIPRDRAVAGMAYALGGARVEVLWPPQERLEGTDADLNNNSVVLRVLFGGDVALLAGEVQEEAMGELLAARERLRARVVKVSHHGSKRMLPEFYAATGASHALIPVGPNLFGHPAAETLVALRGMTVRRSDHHGTISVWLDGRGGLTERAERRPPARAA